MDHKHEFLAGIVCMLLTALAGCKGSSSSADAGVRQTHFPGAVTAGGGTSGEVLARNSTAGGASGSTKGGEGLRGQAPAPGVAGTPGIPEGAGGTASGAAMGGTTQGAAGTKSAPPQQKP